MNDSRCALLIFSKNPVEGDVKTRLIPEWGTEGALHLYKDILKKTIETAKQSNVSDIYIYCSPDLEDPFLNFCSHQYEVPLSLQYGRDLGERMCNALEETLQNYTSVIIVGCDCPELNYRDINLSQDKLSDGSDVVLGPTEDGGYYLIGMNENHPELFHNINWGTGKVLTDTRSRITENRLSMFQLKEKWDLDRPEDVHRYFRYRNSG